MLRRYTAQLVATLMVLAVAAQAQGQLTDILVPGATVIRAQHITELRGAVDAAREDCGLAPAGWTDQPIIPRVTPVKTVHVTELRAALAEAYRACSEAPPSYTDDPLRAGTPIKAVHFTELLYYVVNAGRMPNPPPTTERVLAALVDFLDVEQEERFFQPRGDSGPVGPQRRLAAALRVGEFAELGQAGV